MSPIPAPSAASRPGAPASAIDVDCDPTANPVRPGPSVHVIDASSAVDDSVVLHPASFSIYPGEVLGIAGGSGSGKTTLLELIAGSRALTSGRVEYADDTVALVPQDDIIHGDLPLRRSLEHAADLRIADLDAPQRTRLVDDILDRLDLADRADVAVSQLSGGQRKRASVAAELLREPKLFLLDEPTSGLDPANAAELMHSLRSLAVDGCAVVLATHVPADLDRCDRVVFVARGGRVAFVGRPDEALAYFEAATLIEVYELLNDPTLELPSDPVWASPREPLVVADRATSGSESSDEPGALRQWRTLTRRNLGLIRGNRLTLAILAGSPFFIIAMMTTLFPAGAFDAGAPSSAMAIQTIFWLAFNSFFFGLTYGLLQVVGEFEIIRRERRVGLNLGAYVASKFTVLLPMLAVVNAGQLWAMEATGRLPDSSPGEWAALFLSSQLLSAAAVAIGLHASSAVQNASQATLALPMLCFPQVLFAGAVIPVSEMGWFPEFMSVPLGSRWAFESMGRTLDLGPAAAAESATAGFAPAFAGSPMVGWAVLVALTLAGIAGTIRTLDRRTDV